MAWSLRFSKFRMAVFLTVCYLQITALPAHSQGTALAPPPIVIGCRPSDLDISPEFVNGPNEYFSVVSNIRNISGIPCILSDASYTRSSPTYPERTDTWGRVLSPVSQQRVWGKGTPVDPPVTLNPGSVAHMTMRWKTWPPNDTEACVKPAAVNWPVRVVGPSLLKRLCSEIEVSAFALGVYQGPAGSIDQTEEGAGSGLLALSSDRSTYYEGERFFLHVSQPNVANAVAPNGNICPSLYLRVRRSDGATEIREKFPAGFTGCRLPGVEIAGSNLDIELQKGKTGFDLIPDFPDSSFMWDNKGEDSFQVFQVISSPDNAYVHFLHSNILRVKYANAAAIPRKWGPQVKGVAVDVAVDKDTFLTGEDVPLHLAVENFRSEAPIYGPSTLDHFCDTSTFFKIEVRNSNGETMFSNGRSRLTTAYAGRIGCPVWDAPLPRAIVIPYETTLGKEGWLPSRPGTYTVIVTLIPWVGSDEGHGVVFRRAPEDSATIQTEITLHIINPSASPSK
jgi:hypothetical protein